jgi:hypothetical protein
LRVVTFQSVKIRISSRLQGNFAAQSASRTVNIMTTRTKLFGGALVGVLTLTGVLFPGVERSAAQTGQSPVEHAADGNPIEGAWRVTVTQKVCETGMPIGLSFQSLLIFSGGGTLSGTTANTAFMPGQLTGAFGAWSQDRGHGYSAVSEAFVIFSAGPFTQGSQILRHSISLMDGGNTFNDVASLQFYDVHGNPLLPAPGCATAIGQRLQ